MSQRSSSRDSGLRQQWLCGELMQSSPNSVWCSGSIGPARPWESLITQSSTRRRSKKRSPNSADYWDGNFLWCSAEVAAGAFRGSLGNVIRNEDLLRFLLRLEDLYQRLDGEALLDTLDGWLDVRVIGVSRGQI